MKVISRRRFDALAGYTRQPLILLLVEEIEWFATSDERILAVITVDRVDRDFGWVALARDERLRFRCVAGNASLTVVEEARAAVAAELRRLAALPDNAFHQGDTRGPPVDFFVPVVPHHRLHPTFKLLTEEERYSPAREVIAAMMRFHADADGNFVEQFQTTAFDSRLWELYLFAVFTELGYARASEAAVPDFLIAGPAGKLGIEATTVNPGGTVSEPAGKADLAVYLENYVPIRVARALTAKLERRLPYWELAAMQQVPFALALQDFHKPGAMRMIVTPTTEYVFGVRHSLDQVKRRVEWIAEHRYGTFAEPSGFFRLPKSENISAVIINPQGTITKFNRMGYLAGFGSSRVRMIRSGLRRGERDSDNPWPKPFVQEVHKGGYEENWIEGMVVLHNPHANLPIDPAMLSGAAHEFLQEDGRILSLLPDFHPFFSETVIAVDDAASSPSRDQ